ncbi:Lysosomal amino acid transporter 1 [Hypsizygus marmoreus]|uniref:Lysosomal amino acid transporter 1 n=1 Tax=Hypsizygus marmoreus TaxID=39966 RepID=A0A369JQK0_HYPMA|nr:Lysosomal amino acid transporter 1 [Hypsizygus marmoreus]
MASALTFSDLLGYTSIACWLGAQFPQVLENIRRQSCEGLALPFLANWLLGDFSNLIGCILTHQLPFQTYLATYFVVVDCMLVTQYFYYLGRVKPHLRGIPSAATVRRMSIERGAARYRALSVVAASVAATAALAAQHDEHPDHRRRWQRHSIDRLHRDDTGGRAMQGSTDGDDIDENALTALADSFHSERPHGSRRQSVSWSTERYGRRSGSMGTLPAFTPLSPSQPPLPAESRADPGRRGRPLQRDVDVGLEIEPESVNSNRRSSRASRGATMVFLSTWALFGIGTLASGRHGFSSNPGSSVGKVLAMRGLGIPESIPHSTSPTPISNWYAINDIRSYDGRIASQSLPSFDSLVGDPFNERVIGRIFAWLCTTLYLTSRLPQIWKNYVRKSVEGLSMYLFVFAFLGNTFYVASILTSPKMNLSPQDSVAFIKESIPYLLGSAGTLMFDVTIVTQSFVYRPRHRRHSTLHSSRMEEEAAGLLSGDSVARHREPSDSTVVPRGRTSRIRSTV